MQHFPNFKLGKFPERCKTMNFERDILPAEAKLMQKYGFIKEEVNYIMRYKPTFILADQLEEKQEGMNHIYKFFVEKK